MSQQQKQASKSSNQKKEKQKPELNARDMPRASAENKNKNRNGVAGSRRQAAQDVKNQNRYEALDVDGSDGEDFSMEIVPDTPLTNQKTKSGDNAIT